MRKTRRLKETEIAKLFIFVSVGIFFTLLMTFNPDFSPHKSQKHNSEDLTKSTSVNTAKVAANYSSLLNRYRRKGNYKSVARRQRVRNYRSKIYMDKEKIERECKALMIKMKLINKEVFFDKSFTKFPLASIINDRGFKLVSYSDAEQLYREYLSDDSFNVQRIDKMYSNYLLNFNGFSNSEEKFMDEISKIKKKYYLYSIYTEIYQSINSYEEFPLKMIMQDSNFLKKVDLVQFKKMISVFMKMQDFSWHDVDKALSNVFNRIRAKAVLDKKEASFVETCIILKKMFIYFNSVEHEVADINSKYSSFSIIIKAKDFFQADGLNQMRSMAKRILNNSKDIEWSRVDSIVKAFLIDKIKIARKTYSIHYFEALQYFAELQRHFEIYQKNSNRPTNYVRNCDTLCMNICKTNFKETKDFFSCAKQGCLCSDYQIVNYDFTNDSEGSLSRYLLYIAYLACIISVMVILKEYFNKAKIENEVKYELLGENELTI